MKKFFLIALVLLVVSGAICAVADTTIVDSGSFGTSITWQLDSDGLLTISGTGGMYSCSTSHNGSEYITSAPWGTYYSTIKSITIKSGVTGIGSYAFYGCSSLTSVTIPGSVTRVDDYAFYNCSSLTSVTISEGLQCIEDLSFYGCTSLTSITIPESVISIGNGAFQNCSSLTSVTIPEGVTSIGNSAFQNCYSLTSVTIPEGVASIGNSAFQNCYSLTSVTIPEGVASIMYNAFRNCSSLTSVTISEGVTSIGDGAFRDCSSLTSVTIPKSATSIGNYVFSDCSSLTSVTILEGVTSIGNYAFSGCSSLTSVTIPNGVASVGKYTFSDCSSLTSVTILEGVTGIGNYAFYRCSSLTSVTIPEGVTSIGDCAFCVCSSLPSVKIPESVTSIGNYAFYECSSLMSIAIPSAVTSIGDYVFYGCNSLTAITVASDSAYFSSIDGVLFDRSGKMLLTYPSERSGHAYSIPANVTSIAGGAFYGCSDLRSITIPSGVTSIGSYTFYNCCSLRSINIPEGVTHIGNYAFGNCTGLTSVVLPDSLQETVYADVFACCRNLVSIKLPADQPDLLLYQNDDSETGVHFSYAECPLQSIILSENAADLSTDHFPDWFSGTFYCYRDSYAAQWISENYGSSRLKYIDDYKTKASGLYLPAKVYVPLGTTKVMPVGAWPEQTYTFTWTSSKPSIVSVSSDGVITGKAVGKSTITVKNGSKTATCQVECYIPAESISVESEKWIAVSESFTIDVVKVPANSESVLYSAEDTIIATVDENGLVTPQAVGTTRITVTTVATGIEATMELHVTYPAQSVSFAESTVDVVCGKTAPLTANVMNSAGMLVNKMVSFTSADASIATVDPDGVVSGVSVGTTTITVKTHNGKTADCTVNVIDHEHVIEEFEATAVTCMEDGTNAGTRCMVCGKILSGGEVIPATGHTRVIDVRPVLPTKSTAGTAAVIHCSVCNEVLSNGVCITRLADGDISTLPASLKTIKSEAYTGISVRCVVIPSGCTSIGSSAFANCTDLVVIQIPASVTNIAPDAFDGCGDLTIVTPAGSTAAAYAEAHGIPWTDNWEA